MSENNTLQAREKHEVQGETTRPGPVFSPDIDVFERSDGYVVFADLPGVDDESVDIRLDNGILSLDAQLATRPEDGWDRIHEEYQFGAYHRDFRISEAIDVDAVSARVRNGVLELHLPKSAGHQPRSIPVQPG